MESNSVCNRTIDNKLGRPRSRSPICLSLVSSQNKLDGTKSYCQLVVKLQFPKINEKPSYERKEKIAL